MNGNFAAGKSKIEGKGGYEKNSRMCFRHTYHYR